jgi:hypothetical protein
MAQRTLTTVHLTGEETDSFALHALSSGQKVDAAMSFSVHFEAEEQRIKEL